MSAIIVLPSKSNQYISARAKLGDHRKIFDNVTEAIDAIRSIYAVEGFPETYPTVAAGVGLVDVTGADSIPPLADWPEVYRTEGVLVCVSFIGVRKVDMPDGTTVNGARGFAIYPIHPIDAVRGESAGEAWLWKVVEKEASHVALRQLRNVPDALGTDALANAAGLMPLTVSDYVEESTSESLDTSAFDAIWKQFRKLLSDNPNTAAIVPALPYKNEVLKAIRFKAYAEAEYGDLEKIGAFRFIAESIAAIIDAEREAAVQRGDDFDYDSAEIRSWLSTRDTATPPVSRKVVADLNTVDFSKFMTAAPAASE